MLFGLAPAAILIATAWDGVIEAHWALALVVVFAIFIITCLVQARGGSTTRAVVSGHPLRHLALTILGIAILVSGSEAMVRGGVDLARSFGVSEVVIGLTLVALGTSLPELATSVAAAAKGESEISVGNVLGSNVFNLGLIVGTAFLIRPATVPAFVIRQDIPFLIAATFVIGLVILRDGKISRGEGAGMLVVFAAYIAYIFMRGG
jgi:cation:H+ antiporter